MFLPGQPWQRAGVVTLTYQAVQLGLTLLLTPLWLFRLGQTQFAAWLWWESMVALCTIAEGGVCIVLLRSLSGTTPRNWSAYVHGAIQILWVWVFLGFSLLALACYLPGDGWIPTFVDIDKSWLAAAGVLVLLSLPLQAWGAAWDAHEATATKNSLRLVLLLVRVAGLFVLTGQSQQLQWVLLWQAGMQLLEGLALWLGYPFFFAPLPRVGQQTTAEARGEMLSHLRFVFLTTLAQRLTLNLPTLCLAYWLGGREVTAFGIAQKVIDNVRQLLRSLQAGLVASFSRRGRESASLEPLRILFSHATRWTLYLAIPCQVLLWFWGEILLQSWLKQEMWEAGPLRFLSLYLAVGLAQGVAARLLQSMGCFRILTVVAFGEVVVLALALAVSLWKLPDVGTAALAVGIVMAGCGCWTILLACRRVQQTGMEYLGECLPPIFCGVSLNLFWVGWLVLVGSRAFSPAVPIVAGALVYLGCLWLLEKSDSVRSRANRWVHPLADPRVLRTPTSSR